jgi:hypothetical protein
VDLTDIRPTLLSLAGLRDSYLDDGPRAQRDHERTRRALSQPRYLQLAQCYKQLNAGVGTFATSTLLADTAALKSGSTISDDTFVSTQARLRNLLKQRDTLATEMKTRLNRAAFDGAAIPHSVAVSQLARCDAILAKADRLAAG